MSLGLLAIPAVDVVGCPDLLDLLELSETVLQVEGRSVLLNKPVMSRGVLDDIVHLFVVVLFYK